MPNVENFQTKNQSTALKPKNLFIPIPPLEKFLKSVVREILKKPVCTDLPPKNRTVMM